MHCWSFLGKTRKHSSSQKLLSDRKFLFRSSRPEGRGPSLPAVFLRPTRLLLFEGDLQQLQGVSFCLFRRLFGSLRRFLKRLVGEVFGIPHVVAGLPASAVVAHGTFLPSVRKYIFRIARPGEVSPLPADFIRAESAPTIPN